MNQRELPYKVETFRIPGTVRFSITGPGYPSGTHGLWVESHRIAQDRCDELNAAFEAGRLLSKEVVEAGNELFQLMWEASNVTMADSDTWIEKRARAAEKWDRVRNALSLSEQPEKEGEGDRHKNGAGLSAPMSPKTETISAAIPVANSPELPFDDDAKCQSAAIAHLPQAGLPEILAYALGVHTHARPLAYAIWRMAEEARRIERIRWGHDGDCGADRIAESIISIAEEVGVTLEQ